MNKTSLILAVSLAALLSACGKQEGTSQEAAPSPAPEAAAPAAAPAAMEKHEDEAANDVGKKVFGATCSLCHASGAAGAPIFGNKADWEPRIAQGMDVLYKHALEGFTGAKGAMPARGGNAKLTDDEVKAAVNYMVDKAKNG